MGQQHPELDDGFIAEQRQRLEALRHAARVTQAAAGKDDRELRREWQEPRDLADRGSDLSRQDLDHSVERVEAERLDQIARALEKIDEGTYGLSDESGEPIPKARLEAKPEALRTVEEEQAAARAAGRAG